jgi:hypothetical protein
VRRGLLLVLAACGRIGFAPGAGDDASATEDGAFASDAVAQLAIGGHNACVRTDAGELVCWGSIGNGALGNESSPVHVTGF